MNLVQKDKALARDQFVTLTLARQKAFFDACGFLWIPNAIPVAAIEQVLTDLDAHAPRSSLEYAAEWPVPAAVELITDENILRPMRACIGDDVRFFKGVFGQWLNHGEETMERGRQALHRDFNEAGKALPCWCNCAIYCLNLEPGQGPFWVVPGTHKLAPVAPDADFENLSDEALMLCARSGDAVFFHCLTVHAGGAMPDRRPRPSFFHSYRPGAQPPAPSMPPWPEEIVAAAAADLRPLLAFNR